MNERTEPLLKTYKARLAIVAYTSTLNDWNDCYLESHVINDKGQLLEGKPLKQETIQGMVDVFFDERQNKTKFGGLVPENLIKFEVLPGGHYEMMWYRPEEQRVIHFSDALNLPSGKAWMPALIYHVERRALSIYALISNDRPSEKTPLYRAPFHNTGQDGNVCLGSAKVKAPADHTYGAAMKYWEDVFWLSEFTHLAGATNPTKTNINSLWKKLIKNSSLKWSDMNELLPIKEGKKHVTLESIL